MHSYFTSCIFAARTLDFAVKFRLVFRYEAVVFRRYVLTLLSVGLLRKFEAYLVYLSLIWTKNPRRFHFFKNSSISLTCCYGFTLSSSVFPRELMTCAVVFQLCPHSWCESEHFHVLVSRLPSLNDCVVTKQNVLDRSPARQSWKTTAHVINSRGKTGDDKVKP